MLETSKLLEIIFIEKLILAGLISGIIIVGGINLSLLLLWLGISEEYRKNENNQNTGWSI